MALLKFDIGKVAMLTPRFCAFIILLLPLPLYLFAALPTLESAAFYSPAKFVVKFHGYAMPAHITNQSGFVHTGITAVDNLNHEFGVERIEKLFPESPESRKSTGLSGYFIFYFNDDQGDSLEAVLGRYASIPQIEHVEPVGIHPFYFVPGDPSLGNQWYHHDPSDHDLDSPEAWDVQRGDTLPVIGIADTGVLWNHPDLANNMWKNWVEYNGLANVDDDSNGYIDDIRGWDWVNVTSGWPGEDFSIPDNDPGDFNGHGTHIAGIAAAITNNDQGGAGIAGGSYPIRGTRILPLRIGWSANCLGQEIGYVDMSYAAQAFIYAAEKGVTVMNCSWGSSNSGGLGAAVDNAILGGMTVCVAAGNDNSQTSVYLNSRPDVISVAATDQNDVKANFSNYGYWVDVSAPGVSIYNSYSNHYTPAYSYLSGTSMAAPMVAGLTALLKSQCPAWSRLQITSQILNNAENINTLNPSYIGKLGSGRINVNNALIGQSLPQITVNSPNGGGQPWVIGQMYTIAWSSLFLPGGVNVLLNRNYPGGLWERLFTNITNTGSQAWVVCGLTSAASRIRVESFSDTHVYDISNNNFGLSNGAMPGAGPPITLFSDGFNGSFNSSIYYWGDNNSLNGPDYWDTRTQRPHTGSKSCYCAGFGTPSHPPYDNGMDSYFYLKTTCGINTIGYTDVTFSFWIWYDSQSATDIMKAQYYSEASWVDFPNACWSGNSNGWIQKCYDITGLGTFRFRFLFTSDSNQISEGAYIDDILVMGIPAATETPPDSACLIEIPPATSPEEPNLPDIGYTNRSAQPLECHLYQNAPNPFNPTTTINYQLSASGSVNLQVYDLSGRLVSTLVDGDQSTGQYNFTFEGGGLAAGIYIVRLRAGEFTATRKMVLMK
jgi:subtilisin family serine protease